MKTKSLLSFLMIWIMSCAQTLPLTSASLESALGAGEPAIGANRRRPVRD